MGYKLCSVGFEFHNLVSKNKISTLRGGMTTVAGERRASLGNKTDQDGVLLYYKYVKLGEQQEKVLYRLDAHMWFEGGWKYEGKYGGPPYG